MTNTGCVFPPFSFFFFSLLIFRSSLEGVYQCATLKIAKWNLLTWSQLCLSPSHFKHSPTLLTLSQSGRRSLNMKVDEARFNKEGKKKLDSSIPTHSPVSWINEWSPLLSLIWGQGPQLLYRSKLTCRGGRCTTKFPWRCFGSWLSIRNPWQNTDFLA